MHSKITGGSPSDDVVEAKWIAVVTMIRTSHGRNIPDAQRVLAKGTTKPSIRAVLFNHVRSGACVLHGDFDPGMSMRMLHPCKPKTHTRSRTPVAYNLQYMPTFAGALSS